MFRFDDEKEEQERFEQGYDTNSPIIEGNDQLLSILSGNKMLLLVSLMVLQFIMTTIVFIMLSGLDISMPLQNGRTFEWRNLRVLFYIGIIISALTPSAFLLTYFGAKIKDYQKTIKGIDMLLILTKIGIGILVIVGVITIFTLLPVLIASFFLGLFLLGFIGAIFALAFYIIKIVLEFLEGIKSNLYSTKVSKPDPQKIIVVYWIGLVISIITFLYDFLSGQEVDPTLTGQVLAQIGQFNMYISILSIIVSGVTIAVLYQIRDEYCYKH